MDYIPWVEKYRPDNFNDIVLEDVNKRILTNIIKKNDFPNLLFYGPPGTGKTTTIINLIDKYQEKYNQKRKGLKIHLNASDDRGIDIIRNQINNFVNTKILFGEGMKFIILDEVDYMTKNAQQALRYLIQQYSNNIRFCLICNYISRIDTALQYEFIRLRFSQLPQKDTFSFLYKIIKQEKLNINKHKIKSIQMYFKSDIRSMINFLQSNHINLKCNVTIFTNKFLEKLLLKLKTTKKKYDLVIKICKQNNIRETQFILQLITYIIKSKLNKPSIFDQNKIKKLHSDIITKIMYIIHNLSVKKEYLLQYLLESLTEYNLL